MRPGRPSKRRGARKLQLASSIFGCAAVAAAVASLPPRVADAVEKTRVLEAEQIHLRSGEMPEWDEFAGRTPSGRRLDMAFSAETNAAVATLLVRQDDVRREWKVELNGRSLGPLMAMEAPLVHHLPIPPGTLRAGQNQLSISPPQENDDVLVGPILLDLRPPAEALAEATLDVAVLDADSRRGLPCRLTITGADGALAALAVPGAPALAARPGVVYTPDGRAQISLRAGVYTVRASRGFEFGLATRVVSLKAGESADTELTLRHEVPTPFLVSCDTHTHTFTRSGHGDATIDERLITLAGEGIELPVATDHNTFTDYSEAAGRLGVRAYLTPVVGCEVTTKTGHFNIFPASPSSRVPDPFPPTWPALFQALRAIPDIEVIVLNHPLNIHDGFQPFAQSQFNSVTGSEGTAFAYGFDALELINSSAQQSDLMAVYRGWFAALNSGQRITGVGSSDGHDVSRYIIGQGRTYIACPDDDPGAIDVAAAVRGLREGRAIVSMGLLPTLTVDDAFGVGDLATGLGPQVEVTITVLGPSWVSASRVALYSNGSLLREASVESTPGLAPLKGRVRWKVPRPAHDAHWVAIATGPPVTELFWAIPRPYQPRSTSWHPRVVGSTNPVWIDGDGDGRFTPARAYAERIVNAHGENPDDLVRALGSFDEAVAAQAASLCRAAGKDIDSAAFSAALEEGAAQVRRGFDALRASLENGSMPDR